MRLLDLQPQWINMPQAADGVRFYIGVSFLHPNHDHSKCPTCGASRERRLAVAFWPPIDPDNLIGKFGAEWAENVKRLSQKHNRVSGETFDTLTLTPSIGLDPLWHGHITNGEVTPSKQPVR